ncbi:SUMO-interacting motif-containing protein 1 isoform X5 [Pseudopipra pipra]|uniref:SUMO-interacting motif-containing protein 1 isoform X5 n=1 Tax=Pseudopipra pipra TaxID=415032 RepID=UPI0031396583
MDDTVVLLSDSDSEGARSPPPARPCRPRRSLPAPSEIIDLTCEDTSTDPVQLSETEDACILLHCTCSADQDPRTAPAAPAAHMSHPQLCSTVKEEMEAVAEPSPAPSWHSTPMKPSATTDTAESMENRSCLSPASSCHSSCSSEQDCSATSFNSDLSSLPSMQQDSAPPSLDSNSSWKADGPEEEPPHFCQERDLPPRLSPAPTLPTTPGKARGSLLETNDIPHEPTQQATPARSNGDSKAWRDKLHSFRRSGVQHLFFQGIAPNRETQQAPSSQRCHSGMGLDAAEIHHGGPGTWHRVCHIGQGSSRTQCLREKPPGRLLFLQYVVQTLEDDLQKNLRLHLLQKSIAKKVLSCDLCFNNVKEVVKWLVAAITGVGFCQPQEKPQETPSSSAEARAEHSSSAPSLASTQAPAAFFAQKVMLLLQRMLSIAVEVDRSPTCSSHKIADEMFPFILNIPLRSQREALLNTMESQLLRCRLLELLFQHSSDVPSTSSMSLEKILYFLSHFSVLLHFEDETAMWQRWDEMLQYLSLLLMSYRSVIQEHLRSSLSDRMDLMVQKAKPRLQESDSITNLDVQVKIDDFISRMQGVLGQPFPPQIQEKLFLLQDLFSIVTTA